MSTIKSQFKHFLEQLHCVESRQASRRRSHITSNNVFLSFMQVWKNLMLKAVNRLTQNPDYDQILLKQLFKMIRKIPEETFIQAIINMQHLKPTIGLTCIQTTFTGPTDEKTKSFYKTEKSEATCNTSTFNVSGVHEKSIARQQKQQLDLLNACIENDSLAQELSAPNHPFFKVMDAIQVFLENKYKVLIEGTVEAKQTISLEKLTSMLRIDFLMCEEFFKLVGRPIAQVLSGSSLGDQKIDKQISRFLSRFVRSHPIMVGVLKKILRYGARRSQQQHMFEQNCPQQPDIETFDIPDVLKIEGAYVYTINQIVQFSNKQTGKQSLDGLVAIRRALYKDIEGYARETQRETAIVNGDSQLQILKFLISKAKVFANQIFAQLKFLQVVYGSDKMGVNFGESSYMYSQLSVVFQAIQLNL